MRTGCLALILLAVITLSSCTGRLYSYRKTYKADAPLTTSIKPEKKPVSTAPDAQETAVDEGIRVEPVISADAQGTAAVKVIPVKYLSHTHHPAAPSDHSQKAKADQKKKRSVTQKFKTALLPGLGILAMQLIYVGIVVFLVGLIIALLGLGNFVASAGAAIFLVGVIIWLLNFIS